MFNFNKLMNMMSNPQFRQIMMSKNPQQALMQIANNSNNPMLKRAMELMNSGDSKGLEEYARNLMNSSGQDPDEAFNAIKNLMGKK